MSSFSKKLTKTKGEEGSRKPEVSFKKSLPIVLPIKEENDEEWAKDIHPNLPKPPSVICIYASFRSGKSVLSGSSVLTRPEFGPSSESNSPSRIQ